MISVGYVCARTLRRRRPGVAFHHYFNCPSPSTSATPTPTSNRYPNYCQNPPKILPILKTPHTSIAAMFRRVAAAVPAQAGRVLATAARPSIVSPIRTAAPAVSAVGRRQYHEKDKSLFHLVRKIDVVATRESDRNHLVIAPPSPTNYI